MVDNSNSPLETIHDNFSHFSGFFQAQVRLTHDILEKNDQQTQQVRKFGQRLGIDPEKIFVFRGGNDENAFCYPDGSIYIGQGILRKIEYEEELYAVLAHEQVHYERKHTAKAFMLKDMVNVLGQRRIGEYQADVEGAFRLMKSKGINPTGMTLFLQKSDQGQYGMTHGHIEMRRIVLEMALRNCDVDIDLSVLHPFSLTPMSEGLSIQEKYHGGQTAGECAHIQGIARTAVKQGDVQKLFICGQMARQWQGEQSKKYIPDLDKIIRQGFLQIFQKFFPRNPQVQQETYDRYCESVLDIIFTQEFGLAKSPRKSLAASTAGFLDGKDIRWNIYKKAIDFCKHIGVPIAEPEIWFQNLWKGYVGSGFLEKSEKESNPFLAASHNLTRLDKVFRKAVRGAVIMEPENIDMKMLNMSLLIEAEQHERVDLIQGAIVLGDELKERYTHGRHLERHVRENGGSFETVFEHDFKNINPHAVNIQKLIDDHKDRDMNPLLGKINQYLDSVGDTKVLIDIFHALIRLSPNESIIATDGGKNWVNIFDEFFHQDATIWHDAFTGIADKELRKEIALVILDPFGLEKLEGDIFSILDFFDQIKISLGDNEKGQISQFFARMSWLSQHTGAIKALVSDDRARFVSRYLGLIADISPIETFKIDSDLFECMMPPKIIRTREDAERCVIVYKLLYNPIDRGRFLDVYIDEIIQLVGIRVFVDQYLDMFSVANPQTIKKIFQHAHSQDDAIFIKDRLTTSLLNKTGEMGNFVLFDTALKWLPTNKKKDLIYCFLNQSVAKFTAGYVEAIDRYIDTSREDSYSGEFIGSILDPYEVYLYICHLSDQELLSLLLGSFMGRQGLLKEHISQDKIVGIMESFLMEKSCSREMRQTITDIMKAAFQATEPMDMLLALLEFLISQMRPKRIETREEFFGHIDARIAGKFKKRRDKGEEDISVKGNVTCIHNRIAEKNPEDVEKSVGSIDVIIMILSQLGPLGRRALQVLPQYIPLSSADQERIRSVVYDKQEGQLFMTAHQTVLDNWPREGIDGLSFVDYMPEIDGGQIGGGSMNTVYRGKLYNKKKAVLKVANPNTLHYVKKYFDVIVKIFEVLSKKEPKYKVALFLVQDMNDWVVGDYTFSGFREKDEEFRQTHQGKKYGTPYQIYIPAIWADKEKFTIEEEIEGVPLTDLAALKDAGHDPQQIFDSIVHFFKQQLISGRVLSDIHIGNAMITPDKKIGVLDRNFYLDLDDRDKGFFISLFKNISKPDSLIDTVIEYTGSTLSDEQRAAIKAKTAEVAKEVGNGNFLGILNILTTLRENGVRVPLKITLILKNILALSSMAKSWGLTFDMSKYFSLADVLALIGSSKVGDILGKFFGKE